MIKFEVVSETVEWEGRILKAGTRDLPLQRRQREHVRQGLACRGSDGGRLRRHARLAGASATRGRAVSSACLEIPAGKRDRPDEALLDLAKRELVEEIGKEASEWREVTGFYPTPGFCDEYITLFAATGLTDAARRPGA